MAATGLFSNFVESWSFPKKMTRLERENTLAVLHALMIKRGSVLRNLGLPHHGEHIPVRLVKECAPTQ
jgi:hypothetical protein